MIRIHVLHSSPLTITITTTTTTTSIIHHYNHNHITAQTTEQAPGHDFFPSLPCFSGLAVIFQGWDGITSKGQHASKASQCKRTGSGGTQ
jgi:hypothetical protein